MKNLIFIFTLIFIPFVIFGTPENSTEETQHIMQLAERRAQQVAALSHTGIFELDQENSMHDATPFLLESNQILLVFADPILLSVINAAYKNLNCVESIKELQGIEMLDAKKLGELLRQRVTEIKLKLRSDAYQKAVSCAKGLPHKKNDQAVHSARSYSALENSLNKNGLMRGMNWFCR